MSESTLLKCEDCIAPAEAFAVVASETRLAILEALWQSPDRPVPFSELRRRVGMRDSAQFNYHLGKLTGQFVRKTDEGYDFRYAGKKVVRAVLAGTFNEDPVVEPFDADGTCTDCGGPLRASYGDERLAIDCADCGRLHARYSFPPGGLRDRDEAALLDAFDQRVRHLHCLAADGVCPECGGRMETNLTRDAPADVATEVAVHHRCRQCDHGITSPVGLTLLDQSDVVAFHKAHGVDLCGTPYWQFDWCVSDEHTTVRSTDPWELAVTIPLGGEALRVTLDGDLAVRSVERDNSAVERDDAADGTSRSVDADGSVDADRPADDPDATSASADAL